MPPKTTTIGEIMFISEEDRQLFVKIAPTEEQKIFKSSQSAVKVFINAMRQKDLPVDEAAAERLVDALHAFLVTQAHTKAFLAKVHEIRDPVAEKKARNYPIRRLRRRGEAPKKAKVLTFNSDSSV